MITIVTPLRNTFSGITSRFMTKTLLALVIAAFATACTAQIEPPTVHRTIETRYSGYSAMLIVGCDRDSEFPHMTNDTHALIENGQIYSEESAPNGCWEYDIAPDPGKIAVLRVELYCDRGPAKK
jgi:hypothetical protein